MGKAGKADPGMAAAGASVACSGMAIAGVAVVGRAMSGACGLLAGCLRYAGMLLACSSGWGGSVAGHAVACAGGAGEDGMLVA